MKQLTHGIFFTRQKPAVFWFILTVAAILFAPLLLWYPVGIISAFFLNEPAAEMLSITFFGGIMLLPTILYIGSKTSISLKTISTYWVILLILITIPASILYDRHQKAEREGLLRQHIPAECGNAEVLRFEHFLGDNFDREAFSSIIFNCNGTAYDFGMKFYECTDAICNIRQKLFIPANFIEDTFDLLKYVS